MSAQGSPRAVLALDVDGVLNPWLATRPHKHFPGYRRHHIGGYKMWLCPEHGELLGALDADIVWATTWREDAATMIAPIIGLPSSLPWLDVDFGRDLNMNDCGKRPDVADHVGDRPLIWLDDELGPGDRLWAGGRDAPSLLIAPDPHVGLTRNDIIRIEVFLSQL